MKHKFYHPQLRTLINKAVNNCDICSGRKYDRNPIRKKFAFTETPLSINEIVHLDTYVNSKHSFLNFIDKFSKQATSFYLEDRYNVTFV